jgi:lipoprotein-anchoring transpeptidase ErfK/SrfK
VSVSTRLGRNITTRRWLPAAVLGLTVALTLGACSSGPAAAPAGAPSAGGQQAGGGQAAAALPAKVTALPAGGAQDVSPGDPVKITVADGTIGAVTLTNADGKQVAGAVAPDKHTWATSEPLGYGKSYTWSGNAVGTDGKAVPITGAFATVKPKRQVSGKLNVGDGQTYGIAMPIALTFTSPVADKAAVEKALTVETTPKTEGSWAWLENDTSVHWRPKAYYAANTKVKVDAKLYGVKLAEGTYGKQDVSADFTIGRSQIVRGDTQTHRMLVFADGKQVADYPASYGLDSVDWRNTHNGIHVVMEKDPTYLMSNPRGGYKDVFVRWAVRVSNNGEFIHALPASVWAQGKKNVSHGCVNLSTDNAKAYFDFAQIGDPVEITGSGTTLGAADGDYHDWTYSWADWTKMSALNA